MTQPREIQIKNQPEDHSFTVEELAHHANLSVDTIRFYQTRGLLAPPARSGRQASYNSRHLARLTEIRELQKTGLSLNTIRRIFTKEAQDADRALFEELTKPIRSLGPGHFLTIDQLSEKTSIPTPLLRSLVSEGLITPVKIDDLEVFPQSDVEMARAGLTLLESGIPLSALLELAKKHHIATKESAVLAISLFDEYIRNPIVENKELTDPAKSLIDAFNHLLPAAVALVSGHFERTLLSLAQSHLEKVGATEEIAAVKREINPSKITSGKGDSQNA